MVDWIHDEKAVESNFKNSVPTSADSIFKMRTEDRGSYLVLGQAKLNSKISFSQVDLRMPDTLKNEVEKNYMGHSHTVFLGLIEFALNELRRQNKTLIVEKKE